MRFPLKFALSAVLANTIAAELAHMSPAQQLQNDLAVNYVQQPQPLQQQEQLQPTFRQAAQTELNDSEAYDTVRMAYPYYTSPDSSIQFMPMPMRNTAADAINGESSDVVASYAQPAGSVLYPLTEQSRIAPYANGNIGGGYNPGAFAVQSGYEGFLVPEPPKAVAEKAVQAKSNNEIPFIGSISSTITSLTNSLPSPLRSFATQAFAILSALLGATVVGGGLTTAICTLTPLCTISFALPFTRSGLKSLARPFVGEKNVDLLDETYERFTKIQDKAKEKITAKPSSDAIVTKSSDGKDVTMDVEETIKKVNEAMRNAEAEKASKALADPAPTTIMNNKSNDK